MSSRLLYYALPIGLALLIACAQAPTKPEAEEAAEEPEAAEEVRLPENAKPLSEILNAVKAQGYDPVVEVELEEGTWEIDAFKGEERVEFQVDPVSGEIETEEVKPGKKPLAEIVAALEAQGYGPILEIELDEEGWEIEAVKGGEEVELVADPDTGEIRLEEAEEAEEAEEPEGAEEEPEEK